MLVAVFAILTIASWIYWLVALGLVWNFFSNPSEQNFYFTPPVSILKPVKGLDSQAYENFVSFCTQDYPDFEVLFSVPDLSDQAIPVIKRLQREYSNIRIRLFVAPSIGTNNKASQLHTLAEQAHNEFLVVSDSDMRVTPNYLRRVVTPLSDDQIGLVTCPYRGEHAETFTARLEALYMGVTFLPSVLVARKVLSMRFALGATVALRRRDLDQIGGFECISDFLADDYQLGVRISDLGLRVHLSDYVVTSVLGATTFSEQWHREVRWAQCARISRRWEYPGLLLSYSTPLATVLLFLSGFSTLGWSSLTTSLFLRWLVGWLVSGYTADKESRRWLFWLPVRDMLSAVIWCAAVFGRKVIWRNEHFNLISDGRLEKVDPAKSPLYEKLFQILLRKGILFIDIILRRYNNIYEFSQAETCIFRISIVLIERELNLSDGTHVKEGETIGELHFWNEHIPTMPEDGPTIAWALQFQRQLRHSLVELSDHVRDDHKLRSVKAFGGEPPFGGEDGLKLLKNLLNRWGFDVIPADYADGRVQKAANMLKNLYTMGLVWAFNPASLTRKKMLGRKRDQIWISRHILIEKYGHMLEIN